MMLVKWKYYNLLLLLLLCYSCSTYEDDGITFSIETAYVLSVDAPTSIEAGAVASIPVTFKVTSGCGSFFQFIESQGEFTRSIVVEAQYPSGICTTAIENRTKSYLFSTTRKGLHTLTFQSGPTETISVSINVI